MGPTEFSVKVDNLPASTNARELRRVFEDAGFVSVSDVYVPEKFLRQGFGFVRFTEESEAQLACESQNLEVRGNTISCEPPTSEKRQAGTSNRPPVSSPVGRLSVDASSQSGRGEFSVWVGNIPDGVGSDQLKRAFHARGVDTMTDVYVPTGRCYGFVRFSSHSAASAALDAVQGLELNGQPVDLKLSTIEKKKDFSDIDGPWGKGCGKGFGGFGFGGSGKGGCGWGGDGYGCGGFGFKGGNCGGCWGGDGGCGGCGKGFSWGESGCGGFGGGCGGRAGRRAGEVSLKVGNLSSSVSSDELRFAFEERGVGNMTDVYIPSGKNFGFVRFAEMGEAEFAMRAAEGLEFHGVPVQLEIADGDKRSPAGGFGGCGGCGCGGCGCGGCGCGGGYGCGGGCGCSGFGGCGGWGCGGCGGACGGKGSGKLGEVSLKVSNLSPGTDSDCLRQAFYSRGVESMTDVYVPPGKAFGFVRFCGSADAMAAWSAVEGLEVQGSLVTIDLAEGEKRRAGDGLDGLGGGCGPGAGGRCGGCGGNWGGCGCGGFGGGCCGGCGGGCCGGCCGDFDGGYGSYGGCGKGFGGGCGGGCCGGYGGCGGGCCGCGGYGGKGGCWGGQGSGASQADFGMCGDGEVSIKVSNLPPDPNSRELMNAFAQQGVTNITDCYIPQAKKFGFVRFASIADARPALNSTVMLRGHVLGLEPAIGEKRTNDGFDGGRPNKAARMF